MTLTIFNTEVNLLAQLFGLIMLIFIVMSYNVHDNKYFVYMTVAFFFCALESITLGSITNFICCLVSIARSLSVLHYRKHNLDIPKWLPVVLILPIFAIGVWAAVTKCPWYQLMPPILIITLTILTMQKSMFVLKSGSIFIESGLMVFNFFIGAYVGVIRQLIAVISVIVGLVRYSKALKTGEATDHLNIFNNHESAAENIKKNSSPPKSE